MAGSIAVMVLSRCAPDVEESTSQSSTETGTPPEPTSAPAVTPTRPPEEPQVMMNENREGWYIRYIQAIEPVDPQTWRLSVDGLVDNPRQLSFDDIRELPQITQKSRMKCVEGWSVAAEWMGFRPQALVDLVRPKAEATWVHFHCADDYYESLGMSELMMDRVLFAYGANGALLEPEYGLPLRLIVPFKYGYKGPKAITRISFADEQLRGFWPTMGPYTDDGQIVAGVDRALDLGTYRVFDDMGEIFYEEGLESEDR